jgi:hypothetical protein
MRPAARLFATLTLLVAAASCTTAHGTASTTNKLVHDVYYVSPSGSGKNGLSWATAWRDTSSIDWSVIRPGSQIVLDGGTSACSASPYNFAPAQPNPGVTCGQRYSPFSVAQDEITIERSSAAGHDGTVVIDGGRDIPLPDCGQRQYAAVTRTSSGIDLNGHTGVTINGMARSGIVVRGAKEGIVMGRGGHDTLINMEIFDNGYSISHSWGYSSDGNGVLMGGAGNVYDRLLVHDNGQDEFHSDPAGYAESGSVVDNSWLGAVRQNPGYPGEPFNDLQASGHDPGCTHADGMQIFAPGTTMNSLTFNYDVVGPGINQGLYPSDAGTGTTFDNVTIDNSLFLDAASANIRTDNPVHGWNLSHDTIIATQGGIQIPSNGVNVMTSVLKYGGYASSSGGSWVTSGNAWFGGDPLPGTPVHRDPGFLSVPTGTLPAFSEILGARLTPTAVAAGSPLHSWSALLGRIDALNKS